MSKRAEIVAIQTFGDQTWTQAPQECKACGATRAAEGKASGPVRGGPVGSIARPDAVVYACGWALALPAGSLRYSERLPCRGVSLPALLGAVLERVEALPATCEAWAVREAREGLQAARRAIVSIFTPKLDGDNSSDSTEQE